MSYSYIESVFPTYKSSNTYNSDLYNTIKPPTTKSKVHPMYEKDLAKFTSELIQTKEKFESEPADFPLPSGSKDNLHFYNIPLKSKEGFESLELGNCDMFVKHVLECSKCNQMVSKQLNIETDKQRNEEILEVMSYVMFGIFMLVVLDNKK